MTTYDNYGTLWCTLWRFPRSHIGGYPKSHHPAASNDGIFHHPNPAFLDTPMARKPPSDNQIQWDIFSSHLPECDGILGAPGLARGMQPGHPQAHLTIGAKKSCCFPQGKWYNSTGWWFEPLWKIWVRQLGWLFPRYGKIKNVPNHQPDNHW